MLELEARRSMNEIGEASWQALTDDDTPPFLSYAFLNTLETTGCARPERGWTPCHLTLSEGETLLAAAPGYVKESSEGEFVFDHGWAQFSEGRLGVPYYPKLVLGIPFTPAAGPRILVRPGVASSGIVQAIGRELPALTESLRVSSAHVLFPTEDQAELLAEIGLAHRHGLQYHFRNPGYASFDDFLSRFNSKRRNQIKREMKAPAEQGIEIDAVPGSDLTPALVDAAYGFYVSTVDKYFWGRRYLNRDFFEEFCSRSPDSILLVLAREQGSRKPIGGAFNLISKSTLYGRYWGAREDRAFLHFNVCYYRGIEECIQRKLRSFEPGAGGEHKLARGFEPTVTHSVHHLRDSRLDAAVRDFVRREREAIQEHLREYEEHPIVRK